MAALLTALVVAYAGVLVIASVTIFIRQLGRPLLLDRAVIVLAALVVVRALNDIALMLVGRQTPRDATHLGYLMTSVVALPFALQFLEGDRSRWSTVVLGVASLAVGVIAFRLQATAHA